MEWLGLLMAPKHLYFFRCDFIGEMREVETLVLELFDTGQEVKVI